MYYSKTNNGFYDESIGAVPVDAVEISPRLHSELLDAQSKGKVITSDGEGYPIAVDREPEPFQILVEQQLSVFREARSVALDRLSGIAGRAYRAGNTALADAADGAADYLLAIPSSPSVVAAKDAESLKEAIKLHRETLVNSLPDELLGVFKGVAL
jgi:hypothetical protein